MNAFQIVLIHWWHAVKFSELGSPDGLKLPKFLFKEFLVHTCTFDLKSAMAILAFTVTSRKVRPFDVIRKS